MKTPMSPPSTQPRSLRRNFGAATIGNITYAASQFGMLWALARFTSPTEVGRYALALAITGPVFVLTGLKLRQVQVTDAGSENTFGQYLALRVTTSVVGCAAVVVIALVFPFPQLTVQVILAVALFKAFESLIDICYGAMQQREQLHLVARSMIIRGLAGMIVFSGTLMWTRRLEIAVLSLTALTLWQLLAVAWRVHRLGVQLRPSFDRGVARLAKVSLPLGLSVSIGSLSVNVPRYLVGLFQNAASLGIYAALSYPLVATATVAGALVEAATPRLSKLFYAGDAENFRRIIFRLIFLGAAVGIAGFAAAAVVGETALKIVFGPEYAAASSVLVLLMVAAALEYTSLFVGTAVNAMRMFTVQVPINVAGLATVCAVGYIAVPRIGLDGAAIAVIAGQLVQCLAYVFLLFRVVLPRLNRPNAEVSSL